MGVFKRWVESKKGKTAYRYIRYPYHGKDKWESLGKASEITKTVAEAILAERKKQIRLGTYEIISAKIPAVSEYSIVYYKYIKEIKQIRSYERTNSVLDMFNKIYGSKRLNEIGSEDIDKYKELRQKEGLKNSTINRELTVISAFFSYAYKNKKFFGRNPVSEAGRLEDHTVKERILKTPIICYPLNCHNPLLA